MSYKRCWKWPPSASRQSVARLRTFLLTLLIVSLQYPSVKLVTHCTRESIESGFSLKTWFCAAAQKWKSRGLRSGLWAGHGFAVLRLMTGPRNFSFRNARTAFVQCGGEASYHVVEHHLTIKNCICTMWWSTILLIKWCLVGGFLIVVRRIASKYQDKYLM